MTATMYGVKGATVRGGIAGPIGSRFRKFPGGAIFDSLTGTCLVHVMVTQLDTATADRLSDVVIAALHREFGGDSNCAEGT